MSLPGSLIFGLLPLVDDSGVIAAGWLAELVLLKRHSEGSFYAPFVTMEASTNNGRANIQSLGPISQLCGVVSKSQKRVAARVGHLLMRCRPSAIAWGIWAIVVDSIECFARRARPHISNKTSETVGPLFRHVDTSRAVFVIAWIYWIVASAFRLQPTTILSGLALSVRRQTSGFSFGIEAPATFSLTLSDIAFKGDEHRSAIAPKFPLPCGCPPDSCQSMESLTGNASLLHSHMIPQIASA